MCSLWTCQPGWRAACVVFPCLAVAAAAAVVLVNVGVRAAVGPLVPCLNLFYAVWVVVLVVLWSMFNGFTASAAAPAAAATAAGSVGVPSEA